MASSRSFTTRHFDRWLKKTTLNDTLLRQAVDEMERGLIDADLGGGVVKKRVALPGRGKSAGARTLLATNRQDRWFFLLGFEKSEQDNISQDELITLRDTAFDLLSMNDADLEQAVSNNTLREITHDETPQKTEPHPGGMSGNHARPLSRRLH